MVALRAPTALPGLSAGPTCAGPRCMFPDPLPPPCRSPFPSAPPRPRRGDRPPRPAKLPPKVTPPACCEACEQPVDAAGWGIAGAGKTWLCRTCTAVSVRASELLFADAHVPVAVARGRVSRE